MENDLFLSEVKFLAELEKRTSEQKRIVETEMLPKWARRVGEWLVVHPWRLVVPIALLVYGLWRMVYGETVREFILGLFGGFR